MASRCRVVILGINTPLLDEKTSKTDEGSGLLVPMPCCANKKGIEHK